MTSAQSAYRSNSDIDQRNTLVLAELPQVYYIAAKIRERLPQQIEMEDLVHAGVIGLIEACRNFDSTKNAGFSTFAKFRIRGAILDSLRKLDWGSRAVRKKARAISASIASLTASLGRPPLQEEIAANLKIGIGELQAALTELDGLYLVNQQVEATDVSDGNYDLIESAEGRGNDNPFELCLEGEAKEHLKKAVLQLTEREQLILSLYYQDEMTMREIAEIIGIAVSRVSQIHTAALSTLRASLQHLREATSRKECLPTTARTYNLAPSQHVRAAHIPTRMRA
jgi:RNA polymerase sigma factor for flagellar operon FliA